MTQDLNPKTDCKTGACGAGGGADSRQKAQDLLIQGSLARIKHKLMVMSGKGGVGKSSIAANLAAALAARGFATGLMDVDLHGPSIATMMGVTGLLDITPERFVIPKSVGPHLKVVSMQSLMQDQDQPVIWRGPAKNGVIRQFIADVKWDDLDFLIIDAPPGTGDEPLSVAQSIPDARAVIVTTPQEVALADVRKSIHFCRVVNLAILGLIENMGPFPCPCCGKTVSLFKSEGGRKTAADAGIPFLGTLPFDPLVVQGGDSGQPVTRHREDAPFGRALNAVVSEMVRTLG